MRVKEKILRIFGDIKMQKWPPFIYYEPGDYYKITGEMTDDIAQRIQPGDIVLRGYRNYLDGVFIPGEYSHTGVYIGNGWMIHAVAEGVCYITLTDFLRCDRVHVLRPRTGIKTALKRLQKWIGKSYDFDFQSGNETFYCHELAAEAYKGLDVKKEIPYLGWLRFCKMEPKYLAESFIRSADFETVIELNPDKKSE